MQNCLLMRSIRICSMCSGRNLKIKSTLSRLCKTKKKPSFSTVSCGKLDLKH